MYFGGFPAVAVVEEILTLEDWVRYNLDCLLERGLVLETLHRLGEDVIIAPQVFLLAPLPAAQSPLGEIPAGRHGHIFTGWGSGRSRRRGIRREITLAVKLPRVVVIGVFLELARRIERPPMRTASIDSSAIGRLDTALLGLLQRFTRPNAAS